MRATRRDVLGTVTVAAGTILAFGPEPGARAAPGVFRQGVAAGDPKPASVVLSLVHLGGFICETTGARFALDQTWFDLFARFSGLEREGVYRDRQQGFLLDRLRASDAVWNVHCSAVPHTAMVVDLATSIATLPIAQEVKNLLLGLAEALGRPRTLLTADQWETASRTGARRCSTPTTSSATSS